MRACKPRRPKLIGLLKNIKAGTVVLGDTMNGAAARA
jgi:hypothetical protein